MQVAEPADRHGNRKVNAILVLLVLILVRVHLHDARVLAERIQLAPLSDISGYSQQLRFASQGLVQPQQVMMSEDSTTSEQPRPGCERCFPDFPTPHEYAATLVRESKAYETSPKFHNKINEMLGRKAWRGPAQERALKRLVRRGSSVLDLGCASGTITAKAKALAGADGRVDGVELVPGWVAAARAHVPGVNFHEGDMTSVHLDNATFDTILMNDSLEHVPSHRHRALWAVIMDHAAPGGSLYIHIPTPHKQLQTRSKMKSQHGGGAPSWKGGSAREQFFEEIVCYTQLLQQAACSGFALSELRTDDKADRGYASLYFRHTGAHEALTCNELRLHAKLDGDIPACKVVGCTFES